MRVCLAFTTLVVCAMVGAWVPAAGAASFTPGDIVVVQVGNGTSNNTNTGDPVFLDEFPPTGADVNSPVQQVALPTSASGSQKQLILSFSGSATFAGSEGLLSRSANLQYLTLVGYGRDPLCAGCTGSLASTDPVTVPRVVGRIKYDGTVDTSTALSDLGSGASSSSTPRSATTSDGSAYWVDTSVVSNSTSVPALRYALHGASTSTALFTPAAAANALRSVGITSGQLYASGANSAGGVKVGTVGSGLPTSGSQTISTIASAIDSAVTTPDDFVLFDLNPSVAGLDTLYVADEGSTSVATDGAIRKFTYDGTSWSAKGSTTAVDVRGLTGTASGGTVTLFGSTGGAVAPSASSVYKLTDASAATGTLSGTATTYLTVSSSSNRTFRGVAMAPEAPPTLSRAPTSLDFGNQDVDAGASFTQESTVTNSGSQTVTLTGVTLGGSDAGQFSRLTGLGTDCAVGTVLTAGQTCKVRAAFDPSSTGAKSASVTVSSNAPDVSVALTGTGTRTQLSRSPSSLDFGFQDVNGGATSAQQATVTNSGTQSVTLSGVTVGGTDAGQFDRLTGQASDCAAGTVLGAGDTCNVRADFDPSTVGSKSATVTVSSNAPDVSVALTGTGTLTELSRAPGSLGFGNQDIDDGPTAAQESTVTNSGTQSVTINSISVDGSDAAQFEQLTGQASDCGAGTVLAPNDACKVRARFDPTATGAKAASVTLSSTAGPLSIGLTGSGTQTELSRSPTSLAFGTQEIDAGATAAQESTVTNTGTEPVTLSGVATTGDADQFVRLTDQGTDCANGTVLTAGHTCTVREQFDPSTVGTKAATVALTSNAADVTIGLAGTGTQTQLSRAPTSLAFGNQDVDVGPGAAQESTITNTGVQTVTLTGVTLGGADAGQFTRLTGGGSDCASGSVLIAGQTCKVRAQFDPTGTGARSATITVTSNAPDVTVALSGTGTKTALARAPALGLGFGNRDIDEGPTASQDATFSNSGTEPVTLTAVTIAGAGADQFERLTGQGTDCAVGTVVAAGSSCKARVRFDPTSIGAKNATVTVDSNAPSVSVTLRGTGIQTELTPGPAALTFGSLDVGTGPTAPQESTITNTGSEPVTLTGVTLGGADAAQFTRPSDDAADCVAGRVLTAGQSCKVRARFAPTSAGAKAATVAVASNAADVNVSLSGTGTTPASTSSSSGGSSGGSSPPPPGGTAPLLPPPPTASVPESPLTVRPGGKVPVEVTCAGTQDCTGTVDVQTANAVSARAKRKRITLAHAGVSVAAGTTKTVVLKLSRTAQRVVRRLKRVPVLVTVRLSDGAAVSRKTTLRSKHR